MSFSDLKKRVYDANMMLETLDLVLFTWGNVSELDESGQYMAIKPSGVPYDRLKVDDIVVIDRTTGDIVSGDLKPSSDTPTHLVLYDAFPELKGICHTHSIWGVSWAQAQRDLPAYGTTHADTFYGAVPCTRPLTIDEIKGEYEKETGRVIAECFRERNLDPLAVQGALVANHGPFAWGNSGEDAVKNARILEECCKMASYTELINSEAKPLDQALLDKHYSRKHGKDAYYGQS